MNHKPEKIKITANGFEIPGNKSYGPPDPEQVRLCVKWIEENTKVLKTIRPNAGSYYLKHVVEKAYETYISNGAFIQAAIEVGFRFERDRLNATFNMGFVKNADLSSTA